MQETNSPQKKLWRKIGYEVKEPKEDSLQKKGSEERHSPKFDCGLNETFDKK